MKSLVTLLFALMLLSSAPAFSQCAMCKATVESNIENNKEVVGRGLNDGIIYLMSIPYIVLGGIGFMVYKNWKSSGTE
ncbi:MAG: hypothetical protein WED33_09530 [Bacteroidia bacterium]